MPSFKEQVISSSKWAMISQFVTQVIRLAVSIYLMRLLAPESFGIFMKVLSVIGISEILIGLRLGGGIVQAKNPTKEQISTVFWFSIACSTLLALIFYFSAELIAAFYSDTRLISITKLSSIIVIFMGVGYVPRSLLTKKLQFRELFFANLIGIVISSVVGVWLALHNYDYWSLVWQWGSFNLCVSFLYYLYSRYNPILHFKLSEIKMMWKFSNKIALNDSLNYSVRNIDNILVGNILGSASLGLYSRAYGIMLLPLQNFINIINGVLFPSLAQIQNDPQQLRKVFIRALQISSAIVTPILLYSLFFEQEIISFFVGTKWNGMLFILKVFLILGLIQSHTILSKSVFYSSGNSAFPLKLSFISKPILIAAIVITTPMGLDILAISITVVSGFFSLIQLFVAFKTSQIPWLRFFSEFRILFIIHVITLVILISLKALLVALKTDLYILSISSSVLFLCLIIIYELLKPQYYKDLKEAIL